MPSNLGSGGGTGAATGTGAVSTGIPLTTGGDGTADGAADHGGTATTGPAGGTEAQPVAVLMFEPASPLVFDSAPALGMSSTTVQVKNVGSAQASAMQVQDLAAPFGFNKTDAYPGDAGDCGETLASGQSCTLDLQWNPMVWGDQSVTIGLHYDNSAGDAVAELELSGTAQGMTRNLLSNPSFEKDPGNATAPPPQWMVDSGTWVRAGAATCNNPPDGQFCAWTAGGNSPINLHVLEQTVDISSWSETIAAGQVRIDYMGETRCADSNDDVQVVVHFVGSDNAPIDFGPNSFSSWQEYSNHLQIPPTTTAIRVELSCLQGGNSCDCLFDHQRLFATYPDPG